MMSDLFPDPIDVRAPEGSYGWTPERGFITSPEQISAAYYDSRFRFLLEVEHGRVEDVEGIAPLFAIVRLDREVLQLRRTVKVLRSELEVLKNRNRS